MKMRTPISLQLLSELFISLWGVANLRSRFQLVTDVLVDGNLAPDLRVPADLRHQRPLFTRADDEAYGVGS